MYLLSVLFPILTDAISISFPFQSIINLGLNLSHNSNVIVYIDQNRIKYTETRTHCSLTDTIIINVECSLLVLRTTICYNCNSSSISNWYCLFVYIIIMVPSRVGSCHHLPMRR